MENNILNDYSAVLAKLLEIWHKSRDNIGDEDYLIFIWERSERALALIKDLEMTDGNSLTKMDEVLIPFIMKVTALCDKDLLDKALH